MGRKIFYSWQSDLPNATNRGFILTALEGACEEIAKDLAVDERPEVDRDTQGVPGAPDIASTIFKKIDSADAFVADISIVVGTAGERPCPNPNVLIELGYAIKALGWERIILVMNTAYGGPELLPFDLRTKRVTPYRSEPEATDRATERKKLQGILYAGLTIVLEHLAQPLPGTEIRPATRSELAIAAIEAEKPSAPAEVRRFMQWFGEQLEALAPDKSLATSDDALLEALERTKIPLLEFARLAEAVAVHDSKDGARALIKGFEYVMLQYDVKAGFAGSFNECQFDLPKFVGHEAFAMFAALLIREARWPILTEMLAEEFVVKNNRGAREHRFHSISSHVKLLTIRNSRLGLNRISLHGDLLKERHENGELSKIVSFSEFMEADFFLFLRGQLERENANGWSRCWMPWSSIYLGDADPPRYLIEGKRASAARQLASALGVASIDELRERLNARIPAMNNMLRQSAMFWDGPFRDLKVDEIGSR